MPLYFKEMKMQIDGWMATVVTFIAVQIGTLIWTLAGQRWQSTMTRNEVKAVKIDVDDIQKEIKKIGDVLVAMADFRGDIKLANERMVVLAKRVDDMVIINNARELRYEAQLDEIKSKLNSTA